MIQYQNFYECLRFFKKLRDHLKYHKIYTKIFNRNVILYVSYTRIKEKLLPASNLDSIQYLGYKYLDKRNGKKLCSLI